jgi:hypothetical protein
MYCEAVQVSELQQLLMDLFAQLDALGQQKNEQELPLRDLFIAMGTSTENRPRCRQQSRI